MQRDLPTRVQQGQKYSLMQQVIFMPSLCQEWTRHWEDSSAQIEVSAPLELILYWEKMDHKQIQVQSSAGKVLWRNVKQEVGMGSDEVEISYGVRRSGKVLLK